MQSNARFDTGCVLDFGKYRERSMADDGLQRGDSWEGLAESEDAHGSAKLGEGEEHFENAIYMQNKFQTNWGIMLNIEICKGVAWNGNRHANID